MGLKQAVDDAPQRICAGSVSTHALRGEDDRIAYSRALAAAKFQSTPSARRATPGRRHVQGRGHISIHALREESDCRSGRCSRGCCYFNPRPPRGERLYYEQLALSDPEFQSTPSARRATAFSARAPRTLCYFNPRPPRGERPPETQYEGQFTVISIHALREEGDSKSSEKIHHVCSIIHTCAQFEKELYKGSGKMQNKSC